MHRRYISAKNLLKKINLFLSIRAVKYLVLPLILILFWIFSGMIASGENFSILKSEYSKKNFTNMRFNNVLKGEKLLGEFVGEYQNLGIVAVKFNTKRKSVEDEVIFRIRENNSRTWLYVNKYKTNQFQNEQYFTFGFPVVSGSQGKAYEFEVESTLGSESNSISLSKNEPIFITKYYFENWKKKPNFILLKIKNTLSSSNFLFAQVIYLLPLFFYLILITFYRKKISNLTIIICISTIIIIEHFNNIFYFVEKEISFVIVVLVLLFFLKTIINNSKRLFIICAISLIASLFFLFFKNSIYSEKLTVLTYYLLLFSLVFAFIEHKKI